MSRREYSVSIVVNGQRISKVIIDPHFEEKHANSITDEIIIRLLKLLDSDTRPEEIDLPYSYFTTDKIELNGKFYKLVWLLEEGQSYIGIINAYRR